MPISEIILLGLAKNDQSPQNVVNVLAHSVSIFCKENVSSVKIHLALLKLFIQRKWTQNRKKKLIFQCVVLFSHYCSWLRILTDLDLFLGSKHFFRYTYWHSSHNSMLHQLKELDRNKIWSKGQTSKIIIFPLYFRRNSCIKCISN